MKLYICGTQVVFMLDGLSWFRVYMLHDTVKLWRHVSRVCHICYIIKLLFIHATISRDMSINNCLFNQRMDVPRNRADGETKPAQ